MLEIKCFGSLSPPLSDVVELEQEKGALLLQLS